MSRTIGCGKVAVIAGALILIPYKKRNRRAGRLPLKDAGQDLNLISLLTFGCIFALTGFAAVEKGLDVCFGQRKSGRTPVDHYADAGAVGFAPGCNTK